MLSTPFFIAWRYQKGRQKNPLVSLIAKFSSVGIALGVAVLIVGLSAMNGFERELNQRILSVVPHGEITAYADGGRAVLNSPQKLTALLRQDPHIAAVSPYVGFTALAENGAKLKVVQVKAVDKAALDQVSALGHFVLDDGWQRFGDNGGLVLGYGIAHELGVQQGDWITLLVSQGNGENLTQPERHPIQISGILRLDGQLDHSYALMPLSQAQHWLGLDENQISGVELKAVDPFAVQHWDYRSLRDYPEPLTANNWIDRYGYMYRDIQLIRTVMYIAMVLVIGVACFNIVSTLIMAVKDKQGDIAVLRTLGADDRFIKRIFIWYGLQAGMKGCLIGIALGVAAALNLTALIQGIEFLLGKKLLSDGIYFIDFLPSELHWQDIVYVLAVALGLSLPASLYPANRAAKLQPAQVLSRH